MDHSFELFSLRTQNGDLHRRIASHIEMESLLRSEIHSLKMEKMQLEKDLQILRADLREHRGSTSNIARKETAAESQVPDVDSEQRYQRQQQLLANWMVSQKAFKELAIQLGFEKGQAAETTIDQGLKKKSDVLACQNNPSHGTNADDEFFDKHRDYLKQ